MRVLHLNTHSSGGSYESAALLCDTLLTEGIDSRLTCRPAVRFPYLKGILDRIVRRCYVSSSREPWHGTRRLLPAPPAEELNAVDVVHLHTVADWFNVPSWLETLPSRVGVVVSLHDMWHLTGGCFLYRGCDLFSDTCAPCPILKRPFDQILAKDEQRRKFEAYRNRQVQFVANSQWLADLADRSPIVRACGPPRVIHPGIDTDVFRPQDRAQCRGELGIPTDAFVIAAGAASLTDTNKNIPWLLEQLAGLSDLENVLVLLAGGGALKTPVGLNVRSLGAVSDCTRRARLFCAADIFVTASLMETYGLTLIEAMSCGTPVVAFRTGGVPEAVPDGGGILCPLLDADAFKTAVQKLRNCEQLRSELGSGASKLVAARNAKSRFAAAFARVYEACLYPGQTRLFENQP